MSVRKIKKMVSLLFVLITGVILMSCQTEASDFYVKIGDLNYGTDDYVYVNVVSDNQKNFPVREAECYWTFDGTEPSENQLDNTNYDWSLGYPSDFTMKIPKDFYSGNIKLLCKITYSAMGKKKTTVKKINKEVSFKYHSILGQDIYLDLYKNKGFQEENSISKIPGLTIDTNVFTVKEDGDVKITILLGKALYTTDVIPVESRNVPRTETTEDGKLVYYYKNMKAGDRIKIEYKNSTYIKEGDTGNIKSGEYLIILE